MFFVRKMAILFYVLFYANSNTISATYAFTKEVYFKLIQINKYTLLFTEKHAILMNVFIDFEKLYDRDCYYIRCQG